MSRPPLLFKEGNMPQPAVHPSESEVELCAQFHQASAHDLEYVPPRVILHLVSRLLVQDGAVIENVVDVEIRLHLSPLAELEDPAETEIELFDPLSVECVVGDQVDCCSL